jgi:hypothetical protein
VVGAIIVAGMGVGGVALAISNEARISGTEEINNLQQRSIDKLNQEVNYTEVAYRKLRGDFNILVKEHEYLEADLDELKVKGPNTYFTISRITTRLMMGKHIIQEATRQWRGKKIYPGLMDYFNLTLPCGENECPLPLATGKKCYFGPDMKDIFMEMDMPKINQEMQLLEADPFQLMLQTWNQTCHVTYKGPSTVILSKKEGCPVALNVKTSRMYDLVLSPSQDCLPGMRNNSANSYFSVEHCQGRNDKEAEDFVQVKPHHGNLHIYCAGSTITMDNNTQECPKEVFILPIRARFKVNGREYTGSTVNLEHIDRPDPLYTLRTNTYLKPRVDYQELLKDPLVNHQFTFTTGYPSHWTTHWESFLMIVLLITLLIIIGILTCILAKCYFDHKKIRVKVVTKPKLLPQIEVEEENEEDTQ